MRTRVPIYVLIGVVALAVALLAGFLLGRQRSEQPTAQVTNERPQPEPGTSLPEVKGLSATEQTARAFQVAFGKAKSAERVIDVGDRDMETVTYEPDRLFWTEYGPILLSSGSWPVGMAGVGYMAIHYLKPDGASFRVQGEWLTAIPGSGNGNPPYQPMLSTKFSNFPVIYTESGFTQMGETCGYFELTEIRPDGPKYLGSFLNYQASDDGDVSKGKFSKITHSDFELVFTSEGGNKSAAKFVRRGDRYVFAGPGEEPGC